VQPAHDGEAPARLSALVPREQLAQAPEAVAAPDAVGVPEVPESGLIAKAGTIARRLGDIRFHSGHPNPILWPGNEPGKSR
jgi:hypothetical protein